MKGKRIRWIILAAAVLCAGIFAAVRTRPQTLAEYSPETEAALAQCTEIRGWYEVGNDRETREQVPFTIPREDPRFDTLLTLVQSAAFRQPLFPRPRVNYVSPKEGDRHWELGFYAPVAGLTQLDQTLALRNFYGNLELDAPSTAAPLECTAEDAWLDEVWGALEGAPAQ